MPGSIALSAQRSLPVVIAVDTPEAEAAVESLRGRVVVLDLQIDRGRTLAARPADQAGQHAAGEAPAAKPFLGAHGEDAGEIAVAYAQPRRRRLALGPGQGEAVRPNDAAEDGDPLGTGFGRPQAVGDGVHHRLRRPGVQLDGKVGRGDVDRMPEQDGGGGEMLVAPLRQPSVEVGRGHEVGDVEAGGPAPFRQPPFDLGDGPVQLGARREVERACRAQAPGGESAEA